MNAFPNVKFQTESQLPNLQILQTTILSEMKMAKNSPERVENTVGKGEIAHFKQFLLFPQGFQKTCYTDM